MVFKGIKDDAICNSNNFAFNILNKCEIDLDDFKRRIFYFAIIDIHQMIYKKDILLDDVLYILDKYGETIGINFNDYGNKISKLFWATMLTKSRGGYDCSVSEFIFSMKNIHTDTNLIKFFEKKVELYFPELKDSVIKKYNFIVLNSNNRGSILKHVVRFCSDSPASIILKAAESLSSYTKGNPVASYMRNNLKQYDCNIINCYARDNSYPIGKVDDLIRVNKAVNDLDMEEIVSLLGDNDEFFGIVDNINYVNIINISRVNDEYIGATIIKQDTLKSLKYSVTVIAIHDDTLNVCWESDEDGIIINPGDDGEKAINLLLYAEDM